jgi:AcrR family transcriptional regulator
MSRERGRGRRGRHEPRGSVWERPEPGGRRPRHSREQIAAAALAIADAEGFDAVSMRRVASELGAGTMTLYHYVRTKDELVSLMDDAIMAEVLVPPGELSPRWREALAQLARRSYAAFVRHPWAYGGMQARAPGPNGTRHFEQSLEAVAALDIPLAERFELITLVDDYVFGYVSRWVAPGRDMPSDEEIDAAIAHLDEQARAGDLPRLRELVEEGDPRQTWRMLRGVMRDERRFERGLQRLLDGIERSLEGRAGY